MCVYVGVCAGKYVSQRAGKDIQPRHISKSCVCRVPHPLIYLFVYLLSIYEPVCNVSVSVSAPSWVSFSVSVSVPSFVSAHANMLCSAPLSAFGSLRWLCCCCSCCFLTLAGCRQGSLVVGQVQVAMENGNCDCDWDCDEGGDGDRDSLSLPLSALESASFGFSRSSAVDGGVDVIRFLESNSYSHPAENSHIAFTVWAFSDDVPFRTSHSSNSNWN